MNKVEIVSLAIFVFLGFGIVALAIMFAPTTNYNASIVYVGGTGAGNYTTIQSGINAVLPGGTVYVYNGTYDEQVTIRKSVNLVGESNQNTILRGGGSDTGICAQSGWVNISNLKIDNFWYGIYLEFSSNNTVVNNVITNSKAEGVCISGGSTNRIVNNTMLNGGIGVHSATIKTITIQNNTLDGKPIYCIKDTDSTSVQSVIEDAGQVILYNSSGFTIRNNSFNNAPVLLEECRHNNITFNTITNCTYSINLYSSSNNNITSNTVTNSYIFGIQLYDSLNNNISYNTIMKGGVAGIHIAYASSNNITSNTISTYRNSGIELECGSNDNTVTSNTITNYGQYGSGVYLYSSSNNTIKFNTITNIAQCYGFGVSLYHHCLNNNIISNEITTKSQGINIDSTSSNNNIVDNIITITGGGEQKPKGFIPSFEISQLILIFGLLFIASIRKKLLR